MKDIDNKIIDLEARIAFQEDMITSLNLEVSKQHQQLENFQKQLKHVYQKLKSMEAEQGKNEGIGADMSMEPPPHY